MWQIEAMCGTPTQYTDSVASSSSILLFSYAMQASFKPAVAGKAMRPCAAARSPAMACRASAVKPVPVKTASGAEEQLSLKVAEESARGLVHRYMVMVQQNARRVSSTSCRLRLGHKGGLCVRKYISVCI